MSEWNIPWHKSPLASKEYFLCMCDQGGLLTLRMRNMWSDQGLSFSLNCFVILLLKFQFIGNESSVSLTWGSPFCLLPQKDLQKQMLYNKVNGNRVININDCLIHKWIKFFNQKTLTYRMDTKIGPIYMLSTKNTLQM